MQKKVKITVAPLWVGVVSFFQADGISRMRNKMENEMTKSETEKTLIELEAKRDALLLDMRTCRGHKKFMSLHKEVEVILTEIGNTFDAFYSKPLKE